MKKYLFLGIAAASLLASCTKDEVVEVNPQKAIAFESFIDKSTRAAEDVTTATLDEFEVYGWRGNAQIFDAQAVAASNGTCTYTPLQYWVGGHTYTFEAVAPKSGVSGVTFNDSKGASTITFVSNSETDLIYAAATETTDTEISQAPDPVELTFNHLLSRVKFTFISGFPADSDVTLTVTDVKITNAGTTATYTPSATSPWGAVTVPAAVTFASTAVQNIKGTKDAETEHKYLIPNSGENVDVYALTFKVAMTQGGVTDNYTHNVTLPATELEAGKSYNFTATISPANVNPEGAMYPIVFTASVEPWGAWHDYTTKSN